MQFVPSSNGSLHRRFFVGVVIVIVATFAGTLAFASGWPPFPRNDAATVVQGGTVSVLNSGQASVLANDWDFERDPLTALLTREPGHGDVALDKDGTFVYQHNGNDAIRDEFLYRAFDGTGWSRDARVIIIIEPRPNEPPFTIGSPGDQEAVEGQFFSLDFSPYFDDLDDDDQLRFSASGLPNSGRLRMNAGSGVLSGTPGESDVRDDSYSVRVTARDNGGLTASLNILLTILPDERADLEVTVSLAANPVGVGESIQWDVAVENLGNAAVETGELRADWITSGTSLSLSTPTGCAVNGNDSRTPSMSCSLDGLGPLQTMSFAIDGTQAGDGDHTLLAAASAVDDEVPENNIMLLGGQVVAATSEGPTQTVTADATSIASADLDADGLYDVIVSTDADTSVYFNNGDRTLRTPGVSLGEGSAGVAVVVLDWNGDGFVDVAVGGVQGAIAKVWINDGFGTLSEDVDIRGVSLGDVTDAIGGDFDLDGNDDLVVSGQNAAYLFLSAGGASYSEVSLPAPGGIDVEVADLDGDALLDVLLVDAGDRAVHILRNTGDGRNYNAQTLQRGSVASVSAKDLNVDGYVDLLLAIDGEDLEFPESKLLMQQSDGSFPPGDAIGASPLRKMMAGDVDGDGSVDIVTLNEAGVHQLYAGSGGGFVLQAEQIISIGMQNAVLIDFNNDESLDLIMGGRVAGVFEIHANNGIGRLGLGDRIAPEVTLSGPASVQLASGEAWEDPGATATDDIDGDISASIVRSGEFNPIVVGTYTLTYTASDRAGNKSSVVRSVQVGVNAGTGGSGGGVLSPAFLICLAVLPGWLLFRRRQRQV